MSYDGVQWNVYCYAEVELNPRSHKDAVAVCLI